VARRAPTRSVVENSGRADRGESRASSGTIRQRLLAAARRLESSSDGVDEVRRAARACGEYAALRLDSLWPPKAVGPIAVVDMFSGCGGMSAGFHAVNSLLPLYRLHRAIDIDRIANSTYAANLGLTPLQADIHQLARRRPMALADAIGAPKTPWVLIGCAPCQGFSSHRNAEGRGDPRNSLFVDFARVASALHPDAVVVENVPELLTDAYWPFVERARRMLERAGYYVHLSVHSMAEYGVPQQRYRALMLGLRKRFMPVQGFMERTSFRTVRSAIGHLPRIAAGERLAADPMHYTASHRESTIEVIEAVPRDGGNRPPDVGPACLERARRKQGRGAYDDVYGRLHWDRPSITITAYARNPASGRFVHPEQHRGLSIREAALLQGFPSGYAFAGTLDERFRQIGNAVPPAFAAYLALHVAGELLAAEPTNAVFDRGISAPVGASFSRMIPALKAGHLLTRALTRAS